MIITPVDRRLAADFIYSEYLTTVPAAFRTVTWQIAEDYAKADLLLRLPGYCPMPAFKEVVDVPLVVRHSRRSAPEVSFSSGKRQTARACKQAGKELDALSHALSVRVRRIT